MNTMKTGLLLAAAMVAASVSAADFTLSSSDIAHGESMSAKHEFAGFGCTGDDLSPQLAWSNPPAGTRSFAITAYDPDAPTGSGWWHWQVVNLPATVRVLETNAGHASGEGLPAGGQQVVNDYGVAGFGGACPPVGHGVHRYRFTVHALSVELLDVPPSASGALAGYLINAHTIESATLEALYERQ